MLDQKVDNHLFHNFQAVPSGFMYLHPDTALKGPVEILPDKEFNLTVLCTTLCIFLRG